MTDPFSSPTLDRILEAAAAAPSGDNLQPWKAQRRGNVLRFSVVPERDRSLYNVAQQSSLVSLGALVENAVVASHALGFAPEVLYSDDGDEGLTVATLRFHAGGGAGHPLFDAIARRETNRRRYSRAPLSLAERAALRGVAPADGSGWVHLLTEPEAIRTAARGASLNDRLFFESQALHDPFYANIRWTREEEARAGDGLLVDTLELGMNGPVFGLLRSWKAARVAKAIGLSRTAASNGYRTLTHSAAIGFVQMAERTPRAFVEGGRVLQRLWLTATRLGLAFQPIAGLVSLFPHLELQSPAIAAPQRVLLAEGKRLLSKVFPIDDARASVILFRVGRAPPPTARSTKRPLRLSP